MMCRLCLVESTTDILNMFDDKGIKLQIANIIAKHFWFIPSKSDRISHICCTCWEKVDNFNQFYCFVENAHKNLNNILQSSNLNPSKSTLLPVSLDDLKKEKLCQLEIDDDDDKNEDWQLKDSPAPPMYPEILINKENSFIDDTTEIKNENDSFELSEFNMENHYELDDSTKQKTNKNMNKSKKKVTNGKNEEKLNVTKKTLQTKCHTKRMSTRLTRKYKISRDMDEDSNEADKKSIQQAQDENNIFLQKPKARKKELVKNKVDKERKGTNTDTDKEDNDLEKIASEKKIKEEDELVAKYIQMICNICNENLETFYKLQSHFRRVHKTRRGYVMCCEKKIFKRNLLLDHVQLHINPDAFKCNLCSKVFKDSHILKYHIAYYHESDESKLLKCDKCDKKYVKQFLLDKHKLTHAGPEDRPFECDVCNKTYATKERLKYHKAQVHEKQFSLVCDICAKILPYKKLLDKHRLEHEGIVEPRAQCQKCGSWFKNNFLLGKHLKRHDEALLGLKCEICGKSAPTRGALRDHIRYSHKMERNFKCTFCEKAFKEELTLKEHITTHTGGALYKCTFCTKTFNSSANMYSHRKKAHPIEWEEEKKQQMVSGPGLMTGFVSVLQSASSINTIYQGPSDSA